MTSETTTLPWQHRECLPCLHKVHVCLTGNQEWLPEPSAARVEVKRNRRGKRLGASLKQAMLRGAGQAMLREATVAGAVRLEVTGGQLVVTRLVPDAHGYCRESQRLRSDLEKACFG